MHYTGTIFSYKPFICNVDFVPHEEIFNWLINLQIYEKKIPRALLFARNQPSCQKYSVPNLELETATHSDAAAKKNGE